MSIQKCRFKNKYLKTMKRLKNLKRKYENDKNISISMGEQKEYKRVEKKVSFSDIIGQIKKSQLKNLSDIFKTSRTFKFVKKNLTCYCDIVH